MAFDPYQNGNIKVSVCVWCATSSKKSVVYIYIYPLEPNYANSIVRSTHHYIPHRSIHRFIYSSSLQYSSPSSSITPFDAPITTQVFNILLFLFYSHQVFEPSSRRHNGPKDRNRCLGLVCMCRAKISPWSHPSTAPQALWSKIANRWCVYSFE